MTMSAPEDWESRERLLDALAYRLTRKRLSLYLGAGASFAFKLPDWTKLVDNLFDQAGESRPTPKNDITQSEELLMDHFNGDRKAFAKAIQMALYRDYTHDSVAVDANPLLSAIGALVMSSARGSVSHVITLNYDNILEDHLARRGFTVSSVAKLPTWDSDSDIEILHPHGLLDIKTSIEPASAVVLTGLDYDDIVGDVKNLWRQRITNILRSTTCIFIGLSGNDANLTSQLADVSKDHTVTGKEPFWGVRLGTDSNSMWKARGVYSVKLSSYDEIPGFIFEICRRAASLRAKQLD